MVTADQVRALALGLPRAYEAWVRDRAKFRVGRLVFLSIAPDERSIGFGYPKDARASLVAAEPEKFFLPIASDMRYHWVRAWLDALDEDEMQELVTEAWAMVVPKRVAAGILRPFQVELNRAAAEIAHRLRQSLRATRPRRVDCALLDRRVPVWKEYR